MQEAIKKFNRFELKYLLTLEQMEALKKDLFAYVVPDAHGDGGAYRLSSLYYDTQDYRYYWEKIEGLKFRRKLRIRRYVTDEPFSDESMVYVEIKQRYDRVTQKRRVPMRLKDAQALIADSIYPKSYEPEDKPVLDEILELSRVYELRPAAITSYDRQAFFGTEHDIGLRVTFDTNVGYMTDNLDLVNPQPEGYMIPPNWVILEVKANEKIPYWVTELISNHGISLIRISKYCQALETGGKTPHSRFFVDVK